MLIKLHHYIKWLTKLQKSSDISPESNLEEQILLQSQVTNIAVNFSNFGKISNQKYDKKEKEIREKLKNPDTFEYAHKELGNLLGFISNNEESPGAPDPWWICENKCIVFEDYVNTTTEQSLSITKVRQAISHPVWIRSKIFHNEQQITIIPVVLSPVKYINNETLIHASELYFWSLDDFMEWSEQVFATIRELKTIFSYDGDLVWQETAMNILKERKLDFLSIESMIQKNPINKTLLKR